MGFYDAIRIGASGAVDSAFTVDRSLRFNYGDSPYLTRTPSSTGNQKVWTFSAWIKKTALSNSTDYIYSANDSDYTALYFQSDQLYSYFDPGNNYGSVSDRKFRDFGAWFHLVHQVDAANTTQRIWINGEELTLNSSRNPSNSNFPMNKSSVALTIGKASWKSEYNNMYLAEVHFSDGNKYEPSDFAETNSETGQWVPKSPSITYGTNGFYLNFSDNSGTTATTMGKDSSGNGNNFTPNNLAVSDAVKDSPTNNFCTFNPLQKNPNGVYSEGNLRLEPASGYNTTIGNMGVSSGKWYFEARCNGIAGGAGQERWIFGIHETTGKDFSSAVWWYSSDYTVSTYGYVYGVQDGDKKATNTSQSNFTSGLAVGNVVGFKLNLDDNELSISVDGVDKGKMFDIQGGKTYAPAGNFNQSGTSATLNCGQDSTFHGQESSGGNTDGGGIGDFAYAVPSGYKAICSANLPDPTILLPNKHFDTLLYTGTSSSSLYNVTGLEFQPDWVWGKARNDTIGHILFDAVRGEDRQLEANLTDAEVLRSSAAYRFLSNGFAVSTVGNLNNPVNYVAWNWNAGGSTVTNTDGTISAQVRANASAGFSIVTYTGNGSNSTVGHGLGVKPDTIIVKGRNIAGQDWVLYNKNLDGGNQPATHIIKLNTTAAEADVNDVWNDTEPTSTVFSVGVEAMVNYNASTTYVAYCFSEVAGYSKFGSYTGNGSADGPFVFLGFRPAWILYKATNDGQHWQVHDSKRLGYNQRNDTLEPSDTSTEQTNRNIDILSNGFKLRNGLSQSNGGSVNYIYFAFAESPFKNARAR